MVAVELSSASGEKLQIANGKTAIINLPIASSLLSSAPATIPLWYFDETKGFWKEEGVATKQGNSYVGVVSHFSFWNCDAPFPLVNFEAGFKNQNGDPLLNGKVVISRTENKTSISATDITDEYGKVSGKIPANSNLFIEVYNRCGDLVYSKNFSTTTSTVNMGVLTINSGSANVLITGTVTGCNNAVVTNGFVHIAIGNIGYRAEINNGSFSATLNVCSAGAYNAKIMGFDIANNKQSDTITLSVNTTNPSSVQINTCALAIERFVNFKLNGTDYSIVAPADSVVYFVQGPTAMIQAYSPNSTKKVNITLPVITGTGIVPITDIYTTLPSGFYTGSNINSMSITEFSTHIAGNLSGLMKQDSTSSTTYPITLSFRVKR
jgi:hypothetical protein